MFHKVNMALRAALTMTSALMVICTLLMGYFTWSSSGWVSKVDAAIGDLQPRVVKIESEMAIKWREDDARRNEDRRLLESIQNLLLRETRERK